MQLRAWVYTEKQLKDALANTRFGSVYVPMRLAELVSEDRRSDAILLPPEFLADCEDKTHERLRALKEHGFSKALAHTVGHIELLQKAGYEIYGGNRLNCTNSESVRFLAECGLKDIILSPELTAARINALDKPIPAGIIAYGHLPLMLTRRCPINDGKPCGKPNCGKSITDRKGNLLRVICSENSVEILNTDVLMLSGKLDDFGTDFAVLRFTIEDDVNSVAELYASGRSTDMGRLTRGLYYRGVE